MKKDYQPPVVDIETFCIRDMLTVSGNDGIGAGDGVVDTLDDEPNMEY